MTRAVWPYQPTKQCATPCTSQLKYTHPFVGVVEIESDPLY
jgi:hypothetical protein